MKITYITHACVLVEVGGVRILMDPWLAGPCWGGNIWSYPPAKVWPEDFSNIDYVYLSHAHDDHLHAESVARLRPEVRQARTLIPDFGLAYFERAVRANGFNNIQVLKHDEAITIAPGVTVEMLVNDHGDHDSSLLIHADGSTVLFQTDNLMSMAEAQRIGSKHSIDVVFAITSLTGIFPGFFDFPSDTMLRLAKEKSMRSVNYSLDVVTELKARRVIPYASDLCYFGDLYFANDLHRSDKRKFERAAQDRGCNFETLLMGPGDTLDVVGGEANATLGEHDFGADKLGAYAVEMRHEIAAVEQAERQYEGIPYQEDIAKLRAMLDTRVSGWDKGAFRVLWKIAGRAGEINVFGHALPGKTESCGNDWPYDLMIEMPSYRLQRLTRGDYKMGFLTMQNGCVRCHRHVEKLTTSEKEFWTWAMANIRFFR